MPIENKLIARSEYKILIVDDDLAVLDLVKNILLDDDYDCYIASSGLEALNKIKETDPDLIITDIRMPGMSGVELVENILQIKPKIQCIFMTGFSEYEAVTQAINYHPVAYMDKPFTIDILRRHVAQAFNEKSSIVKSIQETENLRNEISSQTEDIEFKTERLIAEKKLLHGIIAQANFGIIAVDSMYTVHMLNLYALEALGADIRSEYTFQGCTLNELIDNEIKDVFYELFKKVIADSKLHEAESTLVDDKKLSIIAYPIIFKNSISAVVFVIDDITEKDQLLKCLAQSAKLASIGELAAGVAHEINNPIGFVTSNITSLTKYINSFTAYSEALCKTIEQCCPSDQIPNPVGAIEEIKKDYDINYITDDIHDLLNETKDGLARVSKIVADLKTFARAEGDIPQKGQINELIDNALNLVRNEIKYNLTVEKEFGDIPEIECFPNQLVQVFTNLFINASHAVKKEGLLQIKTSIVKNTIKISIKDNGEGIPEKIIQKIFDPFFTTKEPGKGTGMGLSISHSIIQKHQGDLIVESKIDIGTEFIIYLPVESVNYNNTTQKEEVEI